jgi:hypothetical protein
MTRTLVSLLWMGVISASDAVPAMPPIPRQAPALPLAEDPASVSPEEQVLRRLVTAIRDRDQAIAQLARTASVRAVPVQADDPALAAPREARDAARTELAAALAGYAGRAVEPSTDALDIARPAVVAVQAETLSAGNRLAIAQCHQELLAAPGGGSMDDVTAGLDALTAIDAGLDDVDRPIAAYLRVWFLVERARRSAGPAAAHAAIEARDARDALIRQYPTSDLVTAANAVAATLPATEVTP